MALYASESRSADDEDAPVAELVFSCCICQATVTDVYATVESNQGFHSGSSGEDGIVTKMYIGSCSHVVCSKHLENGGKVYVRRALRRIAEVGSCPIPSRGPTSAHGVPEVYIGKKRRQFKRSVRDPRSESW
jgi:hypothetical protein